MHGLSNCERIISVLNIYPVLHLALASSGCKISNDGLGSVVIYEIIT